MTLSTVIGLFKSLKYNRRIFLKPYLEVNIYIPELDVVYIGISKTGISSMKSLFLKKSGVEYNVKEYNTIHQRGHEQFKYISNKEIISNSSFKFSFVRNPFDRLVSCYKNKIMEEDYKAIQIAYGDMFYKGMPFEKFVKQVCQVPDFLSDRHFRSQYSYLFYKGNLIVDFLGKFESIDKGFETIREKYNLDYLPHINKSPDKKDYRDYYSSELVELVSKRYKMDIIKFDYTKELNDLRLYVKKSR